MLHHQRSVCSGCTFKLLKVNFFGFPIPDSGISGRLFMSLTEEKLERYEIDDISPIGLDTILTLQEEMKEKKKAGMKKWLEVIVTTIMKSIITQ